MSEVIALCVADLHLSHKPPTTRAAEEDWYAAQARPLAELRGLVEKYGCPVICAGDVFEKWYAPPSIINFAIAHLPRMYGVPGQHDLPFHRYSDVKSSAYWTLVEAGVIENVAQMIEPGKPIWAGPLVLHGFPFGFDVKPWTKKTRRLSVAVIHSYISTDQCSHPGAPKMSRVKAWDLRLRGYATAVFGDNHLGFHDEKAGDCEVYNCGALIRRATDQRGYTPAVGLLHEDGHVEPHFLDVSKDKWIDEQPLEDGQSEEAPGLADFIGELRSLDAVSLDFKEAVERFLRNNEVDDGVRDVLLETILDFREE